MSFSSSLQAWPETCTSAIPGNEKSVGRVINQLYQHGAKVIYERMADVHVSGPVSYTHLDVYKRQVQRFPQNGWKPFAECKGRRELDCETDRSSRCESRA